MPSNASADDQDVWCRDLYRLCGSRTPASPPKERATPIEPKKPFVWSNEDGNYFGEGHIPPEAFRAACIEYDRACGNDPNDEWGCGEMEVGEVEHEWWYQPDLENEEHMLYCESDYPGALPFTAWRR